MSAQRIATLEESRDLQLRAGQVFLPRTPVTNRGVICGPMGTHNRPC